jgi:hypothetical protein
MSGFRFLARLQCRPWCKTAHASFLVWPGLLWSGLPPGFIQSDGLPAGVATKSPYVAAGSGTRSAQITNDRHAAMALR